MEFRTGDFDVNPTLGIGSTLFTAITTLGLAMIFGRGRTREFIELEIEEGVRKTTKKAEPKDGYTDCFHLRNDCCNRFMDGNEWK